MDKKKYKDPDTFDEEYVKKTRTFPRGKAALLTFCIIVQVLLILFAALYQPKPQDVIKEYCVEVTPKSMRIRKIYLDENERKRRKNAAL